MANVKSVAEKMLDSNLNHYNAEQSNMACIFMYLIFACFKRLIDKE